MIFVLFFSLLFKKQFNLCFFVFCLGAFSSNAQKTYNLRGDAVTLPNSDCYRITNNINFQLGAVWYKDKIRLDKSFDLEFSMNFGDKDADGADGMVFVIQTSGNNALGKSGQGIGYADFSPSLGIEFDPYQNLDENDPPYDHIAIEKNGVVNHNLSTNLARPVQALENSFNIEDGKDHNVRINWNAKQSILEVYFDCKKRIEININLSKDIFFGQKEAWWGFTGATGGSNNIQSVCLQKDIVAQDTFQICKDDKVELVARNSIDQRYTWTPNLSISNTNIRNPVVQPNRSQLYYVRYNDFCNQSVFDSIFVEVTPLPSFTLGLDLNPCDTTKTVKLSPKISPKISDIIYNWSNKATTETIEVSESGSYSLNINAKGCKIVDSLIVTFRPMPEVPRVTNSYFCIRDTPPLLDPKANATGLRFLWSPTRQTTSTIEAKTAGSYTVQVATPYCAVTRSFLVRDDCPPSLYVPDVFTPNADGQNDVFQIQFTEEVIAELTIFNRWGQAIFYSNDLRKSWDGTQNGLVAPQDVYVWQLSYSIKRIPNTALYESRGRVMLLR